MVLFYYVDASNTHKTSSCKVCTGLGYKGIIANNVIAY